MRFGRVPVTTTCTRLLFLGTLLAGLAGTFAALAEEPPARPPGRIDENTVFAHRVFIGVTFDF